MKALDSALTGPAALVLWGQLNHHEVDPVPLNDSWTNEHLPERMSIPGFLRARRYATGGIGSKHPWYLTLYETDSLATLSSPAYMDKLNNPTPGTQRHIPTLASMNRAACEVRISERRPALVSRYNTIGSVMSMTVFRSPDQDGITDLSDLMRRQTPAWFADDPTLMSVILLCEHAEATAPGSSSQSDLNASLTQQLDEAGVRCIVLLEHAYSFTFPLTTTTARDNLDMFFSANAWDARSWVYSIIACSG